MISCKKTSFVYLPIIEKNYKINYFIDSPLYKELTKLGNQSIPGNNKSLITENDGKPLQMEITTIYPRTFIIIYIA